jgi:Mor family transcriptional regulator
MIAALTRCGVDDQPARAAAEDELAGLRERIGGQHLWLPGPDRRIRQRQIAQDRKNGEPVERIARKHNCHRSTVYRSLADSDWEL